MVQYEEKITYKNGWRIIEKTPILEPEERDRIEKNIIRKLHAILFKENEPLDTRVKI